MAGRKWLDPVCRNSLSMRLLDSIFVHSVVHSIDSQLVVIHNRWLTRIQPLVSFGWIGDRIPSRQTPFIVGLLALGATTVLFAGGTTLPIYSIARILQGLSGAVTFTLGSTLLFDVVGKEGIGRATGYTGMSVSLGILTGPVAGGVLYEYGGYFYVFIPAFVLITVDIILRLMVICEKRTPLQPILKESIKSGDSTTETEPLLGGPSIKAARFPILVMLASPRFLVAILSLFTINSFSNGFDGVMPVYVYQTFGIGPSQVAVLFLVLCAPSLFSPITGTLKDRYGAKWPAVGGLVLMILSLILLRLIVAGVTAPYAKLAAILFSFGLAVAIAQPPLITEITSAVQEIEQARPGIFGPFGAFAQAYGLLNCAFAAGSMVGPLYAGFIKEWLGWSAMSLMMGTLVSVILVFAFLVTGGPALSRGQAAPALDVSPRAGEA
ncbi:hypothetical protein OEA41_005895 [Lepraria neglecta]|uniref:Major facilitator superfamily (MFS) profile domain-containing protein n=1 Tax=Lepraria neglecta TaxID=209136 RepID=A0AAE0DK45_9LECA|nr:hypothetical protein OEA41_005895 [Lepraria neglecta]